MLLAQLATAGDGKPHAPDLEAVFTGQDAGAGQRATAAQIPARSLPAGFLARLYAARDYRPLWSSGADRQALSGALLSLQPDGLNPGDYPVPDGGDLTLCAEIQSSHSWALASWHLMTGRLARDHHEPLWRAPDLAPAPDNEARLLSLLLAHAGQPAATLDAARPRSPGYAALRSAWKTLDTPDIDWPEIPAGPLLRPGDSDPRVPLLRRRLQVEAPVLTASGKPATGYDSTLAEAIARFQYQHALQQDSVVGRRTLAALNDTPRQRQRQLAANLERSRWRAANPLPEGVLVDIAGALVEYRKGGRPIWRARAQVGTPRRPTPSLRSRIHRLTVNPFWTVPPTILRQDKLPALRRDPAYLAEQNMEVLDLQGRPLDPRTVDWSRPGGILLRQRPGPGNPLGRLAIRFDNPFSVYLHDTPSQHLFTRAHRSHSSGCVRVEEALVLASRLLEHASQAARDEMQAALARAETRELGLPESVPILLDYWTADVDDDGRVILRPDLYHRDQALAEALHRPLSPAGLPGCDAP